MKAGYIYVLVHPSDPNLYKIGQTVRAPQERLAEHNGDYAKHAGQIVKETGQKWVLKTFIPVPDTDFAEAVFWRATGFTEIPGRGGVEIERMEWKLVEACLKAAEEAGVKPPPKPLPDYVYANNAWMKKRLEGRGIALLGNVKSKASGRNDFQCSNGHVWRTIPNNVAEGEGCPQCGIGKRSPDEIRKAANSGVLCLLIHPDKPGLVKIGLTYKTLQQSQAENDWGDWIVHRYRSVEEPTLAESLVWQMLSHPMPNEREAVKIDLHAVEQAFRELHYRLVREIALAEVTVTSCGIGCASAKSP
ncbi:GIY-YIG nuclease family protein [Undibacter mobilis]|uniref:GIY-YIG nuclease family protein n=1 Tax=Undibacter mobilis TaxID=2292256 RepID=A0A371BAB6_9BRAD|nr:GIY-YIG nuclease family protein [Undibacter mobilis]RDV04504.1 GIY-YIG nuclease family protein [Undibacter mobilis]